MKAAYFVFLLACVAHAEEAKLVVQLGHAADLSSAVFSPDGHHVATASTDGTARLWDIDSGRELRVSR